MSIFSIKKQIYKTAEWMSDEASKQTFINEYLYLVNKKLTDLLPLGIRRYFYKKSLALNPFKESIFDPSVKYPVFQVSTADHAEGAKHGLSQGFLRQEYRYKEIIKIEKEDIFLDIGACIGDTSIWASFNGCKHTYAFEPFEKSRGYIDANCKTNNVENCTIVPLGVSDKKKKVSFKTTTTHLGAMRISDQGDITIDVTDLDSWCEENNVIPTFIKMDIEGAEIDALKGAKQLITTHKPKLAICIYHNPEIDMIEIPKMLKEYVPEYKFYCKKSDVDYEVVLFATVK